MDLPGQCVDFDSGQCLEEMKNRSGRPRLRAAADQILARPLAEATVTLKPAEQLR
jgi:hypothetical protein